MRNNPRFGTVLYGLTSYGRKVHNVRRYSTVYGRSVCRYWLGMDRVSPRFWPEWPELHGLTSS